MAATENSIYQALRAQHVLGNPPGTDPQRSNETFSNYKLRMNSLYLQPDINTDESDADYLIRLATYAPAIPTVQETASYALFAAFATSATNATSASYSLYAVSASYADTVAGS